MHFFHVVLMIRRDNNLITNSNQQTSEVNISMTYTVKTIERKKKTRFVQIHQMKKTLTINKESPTALIKQLLVKPILENCKTFSPDL